MLRQPPVPIPVLLLPITSPIMKMQQTVQATLSCRQAWSLPRPGLGARGLQRQWGARAGGPGCARASWEPANRLGAGVTAGRTGYRSPCPAPPGAAWGSQWPSVIVPQSPQSGPCNAGVTTERGLLCARPSPATGVSRCRTAVRSRGTGSVRKSQTPPSGCTATELSAEPGPSPSHQLHGGAVGSPVGGGRWRGQCGVGAGACGGGTSGTEMLRLGPGCWTGHCRGT